MKNIKICFGKEIHMTKSNTSYEELLQFIKNSFKKFPEQMQLFYKDQDGDNITISCDEDIKAMVETSSGTAKIFIDTEVELSEKSAQEYQKIMSSDIDMISSTLSRTLKSVKGEEKQEQQKEKEEEIVKSQVTSKTQASEKQEQFEFNFEQLNTSCQICTFVNSSDRLFCQICTNPLPQMKKQLLQSTEQQQQQQEEKVEEIQKEKQEEQQKEESIQITEQPVIHDEKVEKPKIQKALVKKRVVKKSVIPKSQEDKNLRKMVRQEFQEFLPKIIESVKSKIPQQPEQQQQESDEQKKVVHTYVICDGCEKAYITGIRYKCAVCEDFDYCETCEATKEHNHPFLKIRRPELAPKAIFCALKDDSEAQFCPFTRMEQNGRFSMFKNAKKASKCPRKKSQCKKEKSPQNVSKHIFEELIANVGDITKDLFGKKTEKKVEKKAEKKVLKKETKEEKIAKQIAEVLGGDFTEFLDLVSIYPKKSMDELVRIIMDEREAEKKFCRSQSQQQEQVQTPEKSEESETKKEEEKIEKKLIKVFSKNCQEKAKTIAEVLGGEAESYLGVVDKFLFSSTEDVIDMILDDSTLLKKYSAFA